LSYKALGHKSNIARIQELSKVSA